MHSVLQLVLAVLVSVVVHWWVLHPRQRSAEVSPSATAQAMQLQVQMVEAQADPAPPPPPPAPEPEKPVAEPVQEEKPVRLSSNDPELEENEGAPPPTEAVEPEKPQDEAKEPEPEVATADESAPEPEIEEDIEEPQETPVEPTVGKEPPPQQQEEDVEQVVEKLSKAQKQTLKTGMTDSDYRRFLASLKIGRVKGRSMPRLIQAFADVREIQDVHRYYGMKVIAVDPRHANRVVEVTGFGGSEVGLQKIDGFEWANFSNRVYPRTAPFFREIVQDIERGGYFPTGDFRLVSIVPNAVDNYFVYKQNEAIRRAGLDSGEVRSTVARFHKTDFGGWILAVERLEMNDGTVKTVEDFELQKLAK